MAEALSAATSAFGEIAPNVQQAIGMLFVSNTLVSLAAGIAIGGIWMGWVRR